MADNINQKSSLGETQPDGRNSPDMEELGQGTVFENGVSEPDILVAQEGEELAKANAHLKELEQVVAGKESEIATLKQAKDELEEKLATLSHSLSEAVASYRGMVVEANSEVIEELVSGDTIESINESLVKAKALVNKVRQGVEAEILSTRVPAGAPERTLPDLSGLSPREKIKYAIGGPS